MSDQVETKQVTWEDLEVAEELDLNKVTIHDGTEWEEGNEPVPTEMVRRRNVPITVNVSLSKWSEALEQAVADELRTMSLLQVAQAFRIPPAQLNNTNLSFRDVVEMNERMGRPYGPLCTPYRDPLTGYMEE